MGFWNGAPREARVQLVSERISFHTSHDLMFCSRTFHTVLDCDEFQSSDFLETSGISESFEISEISEISEIVEIPGLGSGMYFILGHALRRRVSSY